MENATSKPFIVAITTSSRNGIASKVFIVYAEGKEEALGAAIARNWHGDSVVAFNVKQLCYEDLTHPIGAKLFFSDEVPSQIKKA